MKTDGLEIFEYILNNVKNNKENKKILEQLNIKLQYIDKDDMFDIVYNTKTFLFNVWKMNLAKGIKTNIDFDFNSLAIDDMFYMLFEDNEQFYNYYSFYKERMILHKKINEILNKIDEIGI